MSSHVIPAMDRGAAALHFPNSSAPSLFASVGDATMESLQPAVAPTSAGCLKGVAVALALQAGAVVAIASVYQVFELLKR